MIYIFGLILLWFRSEFAFVFFFGLGLAVLDFAFLLVFGSYAVATNPEILTPSFIGEVLVGFVMMRLPVLTAFLILGCAIVAFRKWQKGRKAPSDKKLDKQMEQIRAEIAARNNQRPAGS